MNALTPTKGERTRVELIEAALELFTNQGFHGTSMRQIAEKAGLTVGSIYNHFNGKDDIFLAVAQTYHPITKIAPLLGEVEGENIETLLRNLARHVSATVDETPGLLKLALIEFVELEGRHISALLETFQPQIMLFVQRLMKAENQIRPISLPIIFRTFIGMMLAYKLTSDAIKLLPFDPHNIGNLDDFVDIYLHGILVERFS
jgi:AcrR family transcriptional regulator